MDYKVEYKSVRVRHSDAPAKFEETVQALYSAILQPGDIGVDCGAHVGKHTLPMARCVAPGGRVFAFEPIAEKLALLEAKATAAGLIEIIATRNCVVGDKPGHVTFNCVQADPGKSSLHLRQDLIADERKMATNVRRQLDMVRLDDCLPSGHPCRFMKIDVEGAEMLVLEGARQTIERDLPIIHFEMGSICLKEFGAAPTDIWAFFTARKYVLTDILGNVLASEQDFLRSEAASGLYDYVALAPRSDVNIVAECAQRVFAATAV